jgi:hypothetical protein
LSVNLAAALLLAARRVSGEYDVPRLSAASILAATGAGRSRAYELAAKIFDLLPTLERPVGRPRSPTPERPSTTETETISRAVIRFLMDHPGTANSGPKRRRYTDRFRLFLVDLRERFADVELGTFAEAAQVPLGTLEDWLRQPKAASNEETRPGEDNPETDNVTSARVQSILVAWESWDRDAPFTKFCEHVKIDLRIPYGRDLINSILILHGVRRPNRRPGRSPDEMALRKSFETFFPGAQWVGDGMEVSFEINGERFTFNFELDVDAYSGAFVGSDVSEAEDSGAVVRTYHDGVETTGQPPLSLLLDNRPSNHTDDVDDALGEATIRIRSTKGRGQSKAPVEGGFGLFQQSAPPLEIHARTPEEAARQCLSLCIQIWARTLNHKPRRDRGGRSRVDIYTDPDEKPTPEQIDVARKSLEVRRKKQEQAYKTKRARENPIACDLLEREFARLGLQDRHDNAKRAIARYPVDFILAGIALFESKRDVGTLPLLAKENVPRYLLGIIRNTAERMEDRAFAEHLIRLRLQARDKVLAALEATHRDLLRQSPQPRERIRQFVDRALRSDRQLDELFWLRATCNLIADQSDDMQLDLVRYACRRIRTTFAAKHQERQFAIQFLLEACPALDFSPRSSPHPR